MFARIVATALAIAAMSTSANAADPVLLHAAGSLRFALNDVGKAFEAATGLKVQAKYGASGTLKDAIAAGERAAVFASAHMEHPQALTAAKKSGPVVLFARNRLCALVKPGLAVTSATLLDRMLDPNIKLGTSTPKADPSGDYAWEVFHKAETRKPGSFAALEKKALKLVGHPGAPTAPEGRTVYGMLVSQGQADIFLTYCTNVIATQKENGSVGNVALPDDLAVGAAYGLTVMNDAPTEAYRLAMFILSADAQRTLAKHGFDAPTLPQ
jgi:molybdenum ABC transporter molybdate-binding protein